MVLLLAAMPLEGQSAKASDADSAGAARVFERYVAALGGEEALRSIRWRRMRTVASFPAGIETESEHLASHPDKVLVRTWSGGALMSEVGYDGQTGWSHVAQAGRPSLIEGAALDQLRAQADLRALVNLPSTPARSMRLLTPRTFEGVPAVAVEVQDANGGSVMYFDPSTGLLVGVEQRMEGSGPDSQGSVSFHDYKKFGPILVASRTVFKVGKRELTFRVVSLSFEPIDSAEYIPPKAVQALLADRKP